MTIGDPGDREIALDAAVDLIKGPRFESLACAVGDARAAGYALEVADVILAWLRQPATLRFGPARIAEQDNPNTVISEQEGTMATFDTSQQATWTVDPEDDRGFDVDVILDVATEPAGVVDVTFTPRSGDELAKVTAVAVAPGSALITVSVPGSDPLISGSLAADVVTGGVATIEFGEAVIEEQAAPAPLP